MHYRCGDLVEINDGTSTYSIYCGHGAYYGSTPGTVTGTTIIVNFYTDSANTASGFFAVVTGDATVTTIVTCESGFGKCI